MTDLPRPPAASGIPPHPQTAQRRHATAFAVSDAGRERQVNEDSFGLFTEDGLFVVADGMGGYAGGAVAAEVAVAELERFFREKLLAPRDPWPFPIDKSASMGSNLLRVGMKVANASIRRTAAETERHKMGATAAALAIGETQVSVANVGDVRVYRFRDNKLERISRDHSLMEEIRAARPDLPAEDLERMASRNVVTKALGSKDEVEPSVYQESLQDGDRFLLCCDGLWGELPDEVIEQILATNPDGQDACHRLVDSANAMGGKDNITALLVIVD